MVCKMMGEFTLLVTANDLRQGCTTKFCQIATTKEKQLTFDSVLKRFRVLRPDQYPKKNNKNYRVRIFWMNGRGVWSEIMNDKDFERAVRGMGLESRSTLQFYLEREYVQDFLQNPMYHEIDALNDFLANHEVVMTSYNPMLLY